MNEWEGIDGCEGIEEEKQEVMSWKKGPQRSTDEDWYGASIKLRAMASQASASYLGLFASSLLTQARSWCGYSYIYPPHAHTHTHGENFFN